MELSAAFGVEIAARAAVHLGEVLLRENPPEEVERGAPPLTVEGLARAAAARLLTLAAPRQTLLTGGAFDLARRAAAGESRDGAEPEESPDGGPRWLAHGRYLIPGAEEPLEVFEVGLDGFAPLAPPPGAADRFRRGSFDRPRAAGGGGGHRPGLHRDHLPDRGLRRRHPGLYGARASGREAADPPGGRLQPGGAAFPDGGGGSLAPSGGARWRRGWPRWRWGCSR